MWRYVIKRLLWLIPTILVVSFVVYLLLDLAPGTVIDSLVSEDMTEEDYEALRRAYNLDKPVIYRYVLYMINLCRADLGVSDSTGIDVWETFISRFPNTFTAGSNFTGFWRRHCDTARSDSCEKKWYAG